MKRGHGFTPANEGFALIIALIMLLILTILGVVAVRVVALEEKMAGEVYDRNLALQAAEAALRVGEAAAENQSKLSPPNSGFPSYTDADGTCPSTALNNCSGGLCSIPDKDCLERWQNSSFTQWVSATTVDLGDLSGNTPQYYVEHLGGNFPCTDGGATDPKNCNRYRITARSNPGTGRATVMLQSVYATD
ncbi:MAG: pilus assembly protein [Rhodocyclales bacterium]|nr:pilus assembly protein [Rhodocyclales bacterium]